MIVVPPTDVGLATAAAAIRAGEIVAYPTDTVYGMGVDPFNEAALRKLFDAKGRRDSNPILLVVADEVQLAAVTARVSATARRYMDAFWPGPLSLLFPRHPRLPLAVTSGGSHVCIRCPGCEVARALCRLVGAALTSTSANRSGEAPALGVDDISLDGIAVAIDGGRLTGTEPSTIFDPASGRVLRRGAISERALRELRDGTGV